MSVTLSTGIGAGVTVIAEVAVKSPSAVVTVIVAVPSATAVTTPFSTVAIAVLLLFQVTVWTVAFAGEIVAVNVTGSPPTTSDAVVGLS